MTCVYIYIYDCIWRFLKSWLQMRSHVLKGGVADDLKTVADKGQLYVRCNRWGSKNWRHLTCALEMLADVHRGGGECKTKSGS